MDKHQAKMDEVVANVAKATGIKEADVAKVLQHLGLDAALKAATAQGIDHAKISVGDAKIAFRLGKNLIAV